MSSMTALAVGCVRVLNVCLLAVGVVLATGYVGGAPAWGAPDFPIPVGRSVQILTSGDIVRIYRVYRPAGLAGAAPLVVVLHGGYGDGAEAERDYHWNPEADRGGFVVAYPNGLLRAWNGGTCCGLPEHVDVNDVGFINDMVGAIMGHIPIDPARIYVTGMSNGAIMSLRLGCQTATFAAIAPVAGTLLADCSHAQPTSVLQIHGTADDRVPYNGGPGKGASLTGVPHVDGPSVPSVNATWRSIDVCAPPASTSAGVVTTQTATCADGRTVELISVAGAGHQWPGGKSKPLLEKLVDLSEPSTALDATDTIWQFFSQHHR
jgi:polyhydroxybutyrate depolymerase